MNGLTNLIYLFRGFYHLRIASDLSCQSISLFHAILYRTNELGFPERVKITNGELCESSGICKNTLMKCRRTLQEYRYDGQWLLKYQEGTTHQCGFYSINYDLLTISFYNELIVNQKATNSQPKGNRKSTNGAILVDNLNQNQSHSNTILDHTNQTIKNQTRPDPLSEQLTKVEGEISQNDFRLVGFSYKGINKEQMQHIAKWYQEGRSDQIVKYYGQAVMDAIEVWRKSEWKHILYLWNHPNRLLKLEGQKIQKQGLLHKGVSNGHQWVFTRDKVGMAN
jgi:hypothetical protein